MKKTKNNYKLPVLSILVCIGISLLYISKSTPKFKSTSKVVIKRSKLESPSFASPEVRNRWVWMRDGLDLKAHLLSDQFLLLNFNKLNIFSEKLPASIEKFSDIDRLVFSKFKNNISIDYSGPDDNIFKISTISSNTKYAILINNSFLESFKTIFMSQSNLAQTKYITSLDEQILNSTDEEDKQLLISSRSRLKLAFLANKLSRSDAFQVVLYPTTNIKQIWPKPKFLIAFSIILGLIIGIALNLFIRKE